MVKGMLTYSPSGVSLVLYFYPASTVPLSAALTGPSVDDPAAPDSNSDVAVEESPRAADVSADSGCCFDRGSGNGSMMFDDDAAQNCGLKSLLPCTI